MIIFIAILLIVFIVRLQFNHRSIMSKKDVLTVWFGVPGSGKTTMCAWLVKNDLRVIQRIEKINARRVSHGREPKPVIGVPLSNVPVAGAARFDPKTDIGKYLIENCTCIIDEASVDFNNRDFGKNFSGNQIGWWKRHRHAGVAVHVFSQSYDDMDITFRRLSQRYFLLRRSIWPWFVTYRPIVKKIGIDDTTHQITDLYEFRKFGKRLIFAPPLWKMFDTFDMSAFSDLQVKKFELWT